jgi:aldose 1-epimerase
VIERELWGRAPDGTEVDLFTLSNARGMLAKVSSYGCLVQSIWVPDRSSQLRNVALGFPDLAGYVTNFTNPRSGGSGGTHFGAIAARYANRIAGHSFTLDGHTYELVGNDGPGHVNTLHGGPGSWHTRAWRGAVSGDTVQLSLTDPDGANGFPGTLEATVSFTVSEQSALELEYHVTTDKPTVVNLTNHSYFNLAGEGTGDVYGQRLAINAPAFLPGDETQIPTGEFAPVEGTPFDFRSLKPIGRDIGRADLTFGDQLISALGYDQNFVLAGEGFRLAAVAFDPVGGIVMSTYTDQPGVQLYTANHLVGDLVGPTGRTYRQGAAFALETQHYPDSPHHLDDPDWPSVVLRPGEEFRSRTSYRFTVTPTDELEPPF